VAGNVILLDTHALLWWAMAPHRLSRAARDTVSELESKGGFASSISIWEIGLKAQRRKLDLGLDIDELTRRLETAGVLEILPVDTRIWLRALALEWDHRDPADRVIVATALGAGVPILTADRAMHAFGGVRCVW
jgi:PIN domain nuclease of toxin-antitoxin system